MVEEVQPALKFVDGRGELWKDWLEKFLAYGWARRHLPAGDFLFHSPDEQSIGIECKTVSDITSRLGDARRELAQLIDTVNIPILLVFGRWIRKSNDILIGGQDQLTWGHLWNLFETFQDSGLRFQLALSRDHAFLRINQLYAYYQKPEHTSTLVARKAMADRRVASLMPVPGISKKLGAGLVKHFGSLQKVANATEQELMEASLVGPKKARMVRDWFERTDPYR